MRTKRLGNNTWRVYLNPHDYENLRDAAASFQAELAIRLGGEVGLRVNETAKVKPEHIKPSTNPEVEAHFLRVPEGKDTTGQLDDGKYREAFLPVDVERLLTRYVRTNEIATGEDVFDVTKRSVQNYIKRSAAKAAEETGDDDFLKVSSHDLRAYFATTCLVRKGMNPEVVMEVGGWTDYESIKPYLDAPDDDVIAGEFEKAGMA